MMFFDRAEAVRAGIVAIGATIAIALLFAALGAAHAEWKGQTTPEMQEWFRAQRNANGQSCCSESDGEIYRGAYTINPDGSVTLHVGPDRRLPPHMVLSSKNPSGEAVWWHRGDTDYCFAPGTLS